MAPRMKCVWGKCAQKFVDKFEYRRHCVAHIDQSIKDTEILLPVETWNEVLAGCDQKSLEEHVCFARRLFNGIARRKLNGPSGRVLPEMAFFKSRDETASDPILLKRVKNDYDPPLVKLPIAEVPPPQNVVGFSLIKLNYVDAKVFSFLCTIRHLFVDICLKLTSSRSGNWSKACDQFNCSLEYGSDELNVAALECLLRLFPRRERAITALHILESTRWIGTELLERLLTNVRLLRIYYSDFPLSETLSLNGSNSRNCSPYIAVLLKWMHSPREDGQHKMASLVLGSNMANLAELVAQAQQHFLSATAKSTALQYFLVISSAPFESDARIELPFSTLHNAGQVLKLRHYTNPPFLFDRRCFNFVLCRSRKASKPTTKDTETEELLRTKFAFALSANNKLVLNVARMSPIDESLFPADSADGNGQGPSNA